MKKSFPTLLNKHSLRCLAIVGASVLAGCVGYYPEQTSQPYYGGGGGYYDSYYGGAPYYGPAYGGTTIYYQTYSPGYYYRPGYGYYPPPRPPSHGHDHDDRDDHSDNVKRNWAERFDTTGDNPGRYPHDRDGNRSSDNNGRGNGRPAAVPQPRDDGNRGGWGNRISPGGNSAPQPQAVPAAPSRPVSRPPPQRSDGDSRRAWADRLKKSD